jgi:hypothetical protein
MTSVFPNHDRVKNRIAFNLMNFLKDGKCDVFTSAVSKINLTEQNIKEFLLYCRDIVTCD